MCNRVRENDPFRKYIICLSVCMFVCLYPIKVQAAEPNPIVPKLCLWPHMTLGKYNRREILKDWATITSWNRRLWPHMTLGKVYRREMLKDWATITSWNRRLWPHMTPGKVYRREMLKDWATITSWNRRLARSYPSYNNV